VKAIAIIEPTHNPFDQSYWVSCLRENFMSSSYGEGLETGRTEPGQSLTRQRFFAWLQWQRRLLVRWEYYAANFLGFVQLASIAILLKRF